MSGSDYTQTPNLHLYKPTYDADDEMWGTHLNANADTLDAAFANIGGPFLPTAGGTMLGPLNVIATGALTNRSLQDRWSDVVSVLDFGAKCDGTTDDTAAFNAALASAAITVTVPPNKTCWLPNGLTVPGGKHLKGLSFQANVMTAGYAPSSTILTGPNIDSVTLMDDGQGAIHGSSLSNLVIATNNSAKPTAGAGVKVHAGFNVRIDHVMVWNCFDGFYFLATPAAGGIAGYLDHCGSALVAGHHVVLDTWPELRLSMCRFGGNGPNADYGALAYCYVTGGSASDNILPNGIYATNCQFNEGGSGGYVGALLRIGNVLSGSFPNSYTFAACHAESLAAMFVTDATVTQLNYLCVTGCELVTQPAAFFQLNAATTSINDMRLIGNIIDCHDVTLNNILLNDCAVTGNSIRTSNGFNIAGALNSTGTFNNAFYGNVSFSGSWVSLVIGGSLDSGTLTQGASGGVIVAFGGQPAQFLGAGISFGQQLASSPTDLSKHLDLYYPGFGLSVTAGALNFVNNGTLVGTAGSAAWTLPSGIALNLGADPTANLQPVTLQYFNSHLPAAPPAASSTTPIMDGTAAVGTGTTWARADHVHPTDTSRYAASNPSGFQTAAQVTSALAPYAPLASPTFTGTVTIPGGTINNTTVGATTPARGWFTILDAVTQIAITGGLVAGSPSDLTQAAILLYAGYGLNVTANTINVVVANANVGAFTAGGLTTNVVTCNNVALQQVGGITAAGTTQATATALTAPYSNVSTTPASSGVRLPPTPTAPNGSRWVVWNHGANPLNLYPASGEQIYGVAVNASISIAAAAKAALVYWGSLWLVED